MNGLLQVIRRERQNYPSESALARALGVPQRTLNDILAGRRRIGLVTLQKILERRPEWLRYVN